jgi:predicted AlkP superfamily phosphohydrolase/phosphomutase
MMKPWRTPAATARALLRTIAGSLAFVAACGLAACTKTPNDGRVLIIGLDGMSPRIVDALRERGALPTIDAIAGEGVSTGLRSMRPTLSPAIWTTVATGKMPAKHGILGWVRPSGENKAALYYNSDRKGHALWNIVSERGDSVLLVNWLVTYPPDIVNGVIVSDHSFVQDVASKRFLGKAFSKGLGRELAEIPDADQGPSAIYPAELSSTVRAPRHEQAPDWPSRPDFRDGGWMPPSATPELLEEFRDADERLVSVTLELERRQRPRLSMVLLQGIDRVSHFLWACMEPPDESDRPETFRPTPSELAECHAKIENYYRYADTMVARLIEGYGENDLVVLVSDHGFETVFHGMNTGGHETDLAIDGIFIARGPDLPQGTRPATLHVTDVTPTVLAWLGYPAGRDMDGTVAPFLRSWAPRAIETWDTTPIERLEGRKSGGEDEMMEELRSLGYVE